MSKKLAILSLFVLFAILTHGYLTSHYYPLKYGMTVGKSACNLSETMDCDVAAASPYSNVAGIPLSVFGLVFHLILLILIITAWSGLSDDPERTLRFSFYLSLTSIVASIVLAVISATQLSAWCPFCIAAYIWSFLISGILLTLVQSPLSHLAEDIKSLTGSAKGTLLALALIPVGSFITHKSFVQRYGAGQLKIVIKSSLADWLNSPQYSFSSPPALKSGNGSAGFELVEFADFRCGHCGQAAPSLQAFKKANSDITFKFYNFPLDGGCNEAIPREGDGISCRLAKAVTCAGEKDNSLGWKIHDIVFENQSRYQRLSSIEAIDSALKESFKAIGLDEASMLTCMDTEETLNKVKAQAKMGEDAKIKGTPTVFANGRRLPRGQLLPVLNAALRKSREMKNSINTQKGQKEN